MHNLQRTSLLVASVLVAVTACALPNVSFNDPAAQATIMAATISAAIRATAQAGEAGPPAPLEGASTATASPVPSATATLVPTETPTVTLTPTNIVVLSPTSLVAMISVSVPTNCRSGPGKPYSIDGALLVGEEAQILGRDPTGNYWYIPNPDDPGDFCYVWGGYATITGYTGGVQMFTPPPTPSATSTPTPSPGFDVSYYGSVSCSGTWWIRMELDNAGLTAFRSMEFTMLDLDLDTEDVHESDGFVDRSNCSSSSSQVSLDAGNSVIVASPNLSNDPDNHKMRARIKLCSKTGLSGSCVTEVYNFKP